MAKKNYSHISQKKGYKALKEAKKLEEMQINEGAIWMRDSNKIMRLVKLTSQSLNS